MRQLALWLSCVLDELRRQILGVVLLAFFVIGLSSLLLREGCGFSSAARLRKEEDMFRYGFAMMLKPRPR